MMLYTSGTTGRAKGVVITHGNVQAQVESLSEAWGWSAEDRILLHLPLHHVHGIVNALTCALWNGAVCEIHPSFDPRAVWSRLGSGELTLYMAVPTVYRRLIEAWEAADPDERAVWSQGVRACRLMVSGSAALPVPTLERWEEITGHRLLERYGMTEIGMALSNPLVARGAPAYVGLPLPGVEVRMVDERDRRWRRRRRRRDRGPGPFGVPRVLASGPEATRAGFTADGWFRTGDVAVVEDGYYRILGRQQRGHPQDRRREDLGARDRGRAPVPRRVADCAVVGVAGRGCGATACARRWCSTPAPSCPPTMSKGSRKSGSRPTRCRRRWRSSPTSHGTPWAR
jgi:malonyl-CoA/methylmalonyl-CoA synthetase